jgi:hypothetical protein
MRKTRWKSALESPEGANLPAWGFGLSEGWKPLVRGWVAAAGPGAKPLRRATCQPPNPPNANPTTKAGISHRALVCLAFMTAATLHKIVRHSFVPRQLRDARSHASLRDCRPLRKPVSYAHENPCRSPDSMSCIPLHLLERIGRNRHAGPCRGGRPGPRLAIAGCRRLCSGQQRRRYLELEGWRPALHRPTGQRDAQREAIQKLRTGGRVDA